LSGTADIGLIGLAVMGQNLVLNMAEHGFTVCVYNRSQHKTEDFLNGPAAGLPIQGAASLEHLVAALKRPRRLMLMVKAGAVVDTLIAQLLPLLEPGDVLIDGGNSLYTDSSRRASELRERGLLYVGSGISGGEEGARHGPSIMPGGDERAWPLVRPIFQAIAARADGEPCCDWVGPEGSGHYVKMVHNGIEYGDMQLIAESWQLLHEGLGLDHAACQQVFAAWNEGVLDSYLIEITAHILGKRDADGSPLLDRILDAAGQKGTGKWTGISSLELGVPLTLITESVYARCLSALKEEREQAATVYEGPAVPALPAGEEQAALLRAIHDALYAAKIISYTQGYMLMSAAAREFDWPLNYGGIALMWRGGCIIRSRFLGEIKEAYAQDPGLPNLLQAPFFASAIKGCEANWRRAVGFAVSRGIPVPALSSALAFFDGYRRRTVAANMIQAQRDYFGAHGYERVDRPRGEWHHTDWSGSGGTVGSGNYEA